MEYYSDNEMNYLYYNAYKLYVNDYIGKIVVSYNSFISYKLKYTNYYNIIIEELNNKKIEYFLEKNNDIDDLAYFLYCLPKDIEELDLICYTQNDFLKNHIDNNYYYNKAKILLRKKKLENIYL